MRYLEASRLLSCCSLTLWESFLPAYVTALPYPIYIFSFPYLRVASRKAPDGWNNFEEQPLYAKSWKIYQGSNYIIGTFTSDMVLRTM
jgi:hypothetical protein